jgi:Putative metallopeptidase
MRTFSLIAVAGLATSFTTCRIGPEQRVEPAASIRFEYRKPKDPAHEPLYAHMREQQFLERLAEVLAVVHLPRPLTLTFRGCDGTSNAWYSEEDATITFCYEYLADIHTAAAGQKPESVSMRDAIDGPTVFIMLHETAHAVFDLLRVPVLGREEDAADYFAAIALLKMGKVTSSRMLVGAAWGYVHEALADELDESDYADVHGLDSQRYFNILCLAYGSDPVYFADAVTVGHLPKERAEGCVDEFHQAYYAIQQLIAPNIDPNQLQRARSGRWWDRG